MPHHSLPAFSLVALACLVPAPTRAEQSPPVAGDTRIAQWKDDKKAAFMMFFDDCCPTDVTNVYPELQKRGMVGTYYIVGNKPERLARLAFWEKEAPSSPYAVYGDHTMHHRAFKDAGDAEKEITECADLIMRLMPGKRPRLISYATPGGVKHAITQAQLNAILAGNNLILRPPFQGHGAAIHFKTGGDILSAVDKAVADGSSEYVIFHGVGGDWLPFEGAQFVALLDGLEKRRDELWITDHVSVHKYETERDTALVRVIRADARSLRLELSCRADPALYDQPLTLVTRIDPAWRKVRVSQGEVGTTVPAVDGAVRYDALPGGGPVLLAAE